MTSSGNMPPVSSNSVRRSSVSEQPKRAATPGRYQTGSIATLVTSAAPPSRRTRPSATSRPLSDRLDHLGQSMCALVIAMVGRMS